MVIVSVHMDMVIVNAKAAAVDGARQTRTVSDFDAVVDVDPLVSGRW